MPCLGSYGKISIFNTMKTAAWILFCMVCLMDMQAQPTLPHEQRYGLRLGAHYSLMNFNKGQPPLPQTVPNSWKPGLNIGFQLRFPVSEMLGVQPEYFYTYMQGADERSGSDYQLHYLSLPVLLNMRVSERMSHMAGPQFGLLIHARQKTNGTVSNVTHDTEERSVSAVGALQVHFTPAWYADLRYVHGLNHIGLGQRSAVKEFKWQGVELGVGYTW